jgi:hypothetical protein
MAEKVLACVGRAWSSLQNREKAVVCSILSPLACIPTRSGLKKPSDTYFKNVTLFDDIPVLYFPSQATKDAATAASSSKEEKSSFGSMLGGFLNSVVDAATNSSNRLPVYEAFLKALGVRDVIDLQLVFDRLDSLNWDHQNLVKYLASVKDKLSGKEMEQLKSTPLFPREEAGKTDDKNKRYLASQLYVPSEELRGLGIAILSWYLLNVILIQQERKVE